MSMRCIVVPLDGSSHAEDAIPPAAAIARAAGARLHFVAVQEDAGDLPYERIPALVRVIEQRHRDRTQTYLEMIAQRVGSGRGVRVSSEIRAGCVADGILAAARDHAANLIVMSTHGYGGLRRLCMGSATDQVMRRSDAPVLIVRPEPHRETELDRDWSLAGVLVPLDGSAGAERALLAARSLASLFRASIELFHVVTTHFDELPAGFGAPATQAPVTMAQRHQQAERYLADVATRLHAQGMAAASSVVDDDGVARAICQRARDGRAGLIALATHGRGGAQRALLGSVADRVTREAGTPVLVVPPLRVAQAAAASGALLGAPPLDPLA